jgi:hypothetical protein
MNAEVPLLAALLPKILEKTLNRSCQEVGCTPKQRQALTEMLSKAYPGFGSAHGG